MSTLCAAGEFYKIDSTRVTIREYMLETRNPLVLALAVALKAIRVRIPSWTDDVPTPSLQPHEVELLEEKLQEQVLPQVAELVRLGFVEPVYHQVQDDVNQVTTALVTMVDGKGVVGRVHLRQSGRFSPPKVKVFTEFVTPLTDGGFVWTISGKPDMLAPEQCVVERQVNAGVEELYKIHQKRVAGIVRAPARNGMQGRDVMERLQGELWAFHTGRGVFRPLKKAEAEELARKTVTNRAGTVDVASGTLEERRHRAVLQEIDAIQNKKGSWAGAIWLLVITVVLFVAVGRGGWDMKDFLYLVPILFVHEAGHYVAMKMFGYRNLRMFFIPFLGAAVTGRNYNVAGWKKVIVSLAGPVPGIVIGVLLGIWGLVNHKPEAVHVATLALVINGFNLLPLMPLDGGHVMHSLLFSRHYLLDMAFRVMAAVLLLGLGIIGGKMLIYVGIMMLVGTPAAYRIAKVAYDLKEEGVSGASEDGQTIPPDLAEKIVDRLAVSKQGKPQPVKVLAQQTLTVFESLNARPPGVLGTLGFLGVHGGAFMMMLVAAIVFVVMDSNTFKTALQEAQRGLPAHQVPAAEEVVWRGEKFEEPGAGHVSVVATFEGKRKADEAAKKVAGEMPATGEVVVFGETVIVMVSEKDSAAREAAFKTLEGQTKDVYVETEQQYSTVRFTGIAHGEADAKALVEELNEALSNAYRRVDGETRKQLVMPWHAGHGATEAEYAAYRKARRTMTEINKMGGNVYRDPAMQAVREKVVAARRRGDIAEVKRLLEEQKTVQIKRERELVEGLRSQVPGKLDGAVLEAALAAPATQPLAYQWEMPAEVEKRLGYLGSGADEARRTAAMGGWARANGLYIDVSLTLADVAHGAPAVAAWLKERGVIDMRYDVYEPVGARDLAEDPELQ